MSRCSSDSESLWGPATPRGYTPVNEPNPFSPQYWAEDGSKLYPDEVNTTIEELQDCVIRTYAFGTIFGPSVAPDNEIGDFLRVSDLYDISTRRWRGVPDQCTDVSQLFDPMRAIIDAIVGSFGIAHTRPVLDSFSVPEQDLLFGELYQQPGARYLKTPLKRVPHMTALGLPGSNFGPIPSPFQSGLSYKACISPIDFRLEENRHFTGDIVQLALYARQCFMQQHNRQFVYALVISESNIELFMFDRSGVCCSRPYDIHCEAKDFVRLILEVCSPDDSAVGFDTTVHWDQNAHGEWRRYICSFDGNDRPHCYLLSSNTPLFNRWFIEGRGTTCWATQNENGERLLIKDVWRDVTSSREWEFLEGASGLEGVGQMVNAEEGLRVSTLRGFTVDLLPANMRSAFVDRKFCRMVLKDYGSLTINKFEGRRDLLFGFRGAIEGHQNLWNAGILHGDINMDNIILTSRHVAHGRRGVLIDLDLAMWVKGGRDQPDVNFHNQGTRAYTSINCLESFHSPRAGFSRDYLDDLESFYYLLAHICSTFTGPGEQLPSNPDFFKQWDQTNTVSAMVAKMGGFLYPDYEPTAYFGPAFVDLLNKLRAFFGRESGRKRAEAARRKRSGEPAPTWRELRVSAAQDYATILRLFDDAIYEVQHGRPVNVDRDAKARIIALADSPPVRVGYTPIRPLETKRNANTHLKRMSDENANEGLNPPPKRQRIFPMPF